MGKLSKEEKLIDFLIGLLADADNPDNDLNGIMFKMFVKPLISDKNCH